MCLEYRNNKTKYVSRIQEQQNKQKNCAEQQVADCCWTLGRDIPQAKQSRKIVTVTF